MVAQVVDRLIESGRVPDPILRLGIRASCASRLWQERGSNPERVVELLRAAAVAERPEKANEQHYELPPRFFELVLGPRLKYSCCLWSEAVTTLAAAEEAMLELTCARARIEDGMTLLDLGCGWGSLTGWLAERYPRSRVLAVSNSRLQREHILARDLPNVEVLTADVNTLDLDGSSFDRILSVEMLEHVRNYDALFDRIAGWLAPDGRFFCHVFSHRRHAYVYERGWMARTFFTAGTMPSHDLFLRFQRSLELEGRWRVGGEHYARTAEAWLARLDERRDEALAVLAEAYGDERAGAWLENWRVFFLACAELWGFRGGREWQVSHFLFRKRLRPPVG